jgi:hypothetical protein
MKDANPEGEFSVGITDQEDANATDTTAQNGSNNQQQRGTVK